MKTDVVEEVITPLITDPLDAPAASSLYRRVTVKPAMSGHNSLFAGQLGDWTWDTVSALCGTNVFSAINGSGAPTYLAFYYFHIKASPALHVAGLAFGDQLNVISTPFNFGSESILTLHRISKAGTDGPADQTIDLEEFYDDPRSDCMYVETFNRWIARTRANSNQALVRSSPIDFKHAHLPDLPDRYSPRIACGHARTNNTFHDVNSPEYVRVAADFETDYQIDITRDINAVGLVYFASYFSIIDGALLRLWRHLEKGTRSFLNRVVLDHKLCYLGNADLDSVLKIRLSSWRKLADQRHEVYNAVVEDSETMRVIAVCTIHVLSEVSL